MNLSALNAFIQGGGTATLTGHSAAPASARPRETAVAATPTASAPQDIRQRPQDARPVLDMSDATLTRRDIPRGSILDIIA